MVELLYGPFRLIGPNELNESALAELESISGDRGVTGMNFFSSEIAQVDSGEFV